MGLENQHWEGRRIVEEMRYKLIPPAVAKGRNV